jgi:hypothetical protein
MKQTADGQVPDRAYYYLLDWRDAHLGEFTSFTKKDKVKDLNTTEFWAVFDYAVSQDKRYWGPVV